MKSKVAVAAFVITISFLIGYLTYFGTTLFVEFLQGQFDSCDKQTHSCAHKEIKPTYN